MGSIVSGVVTVVFLLLLLAWLASVSGPLAVLVLILIFTVVVSAVIANIRKSLHASQGPIQRDESDDKDDGIDAGRDRWRSETKRISAPPYVSGERWQNGRRLVVDTETTGLGRRSEVLEVAIIDADTGDVLYDAPVLPAGPIQRAAAAVHGSYAREIETARCTAVADPS